MANRPKQFVMANSSASDTILIILLSIFTLCTPVLVFIACLILLHFCCKLFCPKSRTYVPRSETDGLVRDENTNFVNSEMQELPPSYNSVIHNKY